jgi:hypothetical protein
MTITHTCGGPKFGRRTAGCPRCDELSTGAEPVRGWGFAKREQERLRCVAIHRHYRTDECSRQCGPVCVRFDP